MAIALAVPRAKIMSPPRRSRVILMDLWHRSTGNPAAGRRISCETTWLRIGEVLISDANVPTDDDDKAEIQAALRNPDAFDALYRRHYARVWRYLRACTGEDSDASDLAQQTFLQAFQALSNYRGSGTFIGWLMRIARNLVLSRHPSGSGTSSRAPALSLEDLPEMAATSGVTPEGAYLRREALERLAALVATLTTAQRDLLSLRFAADLTIPQIAALIGKKPEAVKKQMQRLLHALKERYDAEA